MPQVSVIIPVYNAETSIERCIKSVLVQDLDGFELILVNDGSTDRSPLLMDSYAKKDGRIVVVHQANGGELAARAAGVKKAKGEWLYFVDADDAVLPDALSCMYACTSSETDLVVFESDCDCEYSPMAYVEALLHCRHWTVWGKLYRRSLFDDYVVDIPRYFKVGGDFLTNLKVARNLGGKVVCRKLKKYIYTVGSAGSVQAQHKYDYEYERSMVLAVDDIVSTLSQCETIKKALFKWKMVWLGGMIGLRYAIDYSDKWIVDLERESLAMSLSQKERIVLKSIHNKNLRCWLVLEKKLRLFLRKLLRR